jgi:hypothetical protein
MLTLDHELFPSMCNNIAVVEYRQPNQSDNLIELPLQVIVLGGRIAQLIPALFQGVDTPKGIHNL